MQKIVQYLLLSFITIAFLNGCSLHPKITIENIQKDIVGKSTDEGLMSWKFAENEPREISIIEIKYDGDKATVIIEMKSQYVSFGKIIKRAGKLRLHYEWIVNEWNIIRVENLTFK